MQHELSRPPVTVTRPLWMRISTLMLLTIIIVILIVLLLFVPSSWSSSCFSSPTLEIDAVPVIRPSP